MDERIIRRAWALLGELTPLAADCGQHCGAACCAPDEDGQGCVYLFPGERALLTGEPWAELAPQGELGGAWMLSCAGHCRRSRRPMGCRIFPLTPVWRKDGTLDVRMDRRAFAMCPLAPSGAKGLNPAFVAAVRQALSLIAGDPEGERFLREWAALEAMYGQIL